MRRYVAFAAVALSCRSAATDRPWQTSLTFRDRTATARVDASGYRLESGGSIRVIAPQPARTETASALFDTLFALGQAELAEARVTEIKDGAFENGRALPCDCFETGKQWTYVWTRDSAYAIDLALGRFDPARSRRTLEFKLSTVREPSAPKGLYVVQDTGSGGSWPISTDRVVWFLGARHLLDDAAFADQVYAALTDTLAQDKQYVFDARAGLYRGETSFLDWREQTYSSSTQHDVRFIAESFALSTNVLYHEALVLAAKLAGAHGDAAAAARYHSEADALRAAIDKRFLREDRGLYLS